jgi:DNA-binding PadR family transcriptional regulator
MGPLTTRGALMQALRDGPAYGSELIRRLVQLSRGTIRLSAARVYPVLKQLERERLVVASSVVPRGKRGARERIYYDLTPEGIEDSTRERAVLFSLLLPPVVVEVSARERRRMAARLLEMEDLSSFGEQLRAAVRAQER